MSLSSHLVEREKQIPFSGLSPRDGEQEVPPEVANTLDIPRYPEASLKDIIDILPQAESRKVEIDNEFVANNGIVATDEIQEFLQQDPTLDGELSAFDNDGESGRDDVFDVSRGSPRRRAHDAKAIIDKRREALHGLGYDVKYHWQIPSDSYSIINPTDWYYECHKVLEKNGERSPFGWVEFDDYGGIVDFYLLLPTQKFTPPSVNEGVDSPIESSQDNSRRPVLLGFHSGYRFDGSRSLDFELFGFDTEHQTAYWGLGGFKNQPHRGDVMRYAGDWWVDGYDSISQATSMDGNLLNDISEATTLQLDFNDAEWSISEFVECLGLPPTYAESVEERATEMSEYPHIISMWNLYVNINFVIDAKYSEKEKSRNSLTFQGHARVARKLLRDPETEINRAKRNYDEKSDEADDMAESQRTLNESLDGINGVLKKESEMSTIEKMEITEQIQATLD